MREAFVTKDKLDEYVVKANPFFEAYEPLLARLFPSNEHLVEEQLLAPHGLEVCPSARPNAPRSDVCLQDKTQR